VTRDEGAPFLLALEREAARESVFALLPVAQGSPMAVGGVAEQRA
jgi:hypothetical protein